VSTMARATVCYRSPAFQAAPPARATFMATVSDSADGTSRV